MIKRVLLLPGLGTQYVGMLGSLPEDPRLQSILDRADDVLEFRLSKLMKEGPAEALNLTENAQPAIMLSSIVQNIQVHWAYLRHVHGVCADSFQFGLGHCLGEYTASILGGAISFEDGIRLAHIRGKAMQEAVEGLAFRMALVGVSEQTVREVLTMVQLDGVCEISGVDHDQQVVLSGTQTAVDEVLRVLKMDYNASCRNLDISAPLHCTLMKPAAEVVKRELENIDVNDSSLPIVSNASRKNVFKAEELRNSLIDNVASPAMFLKNIEFVINQGANLFTELGTRKSLMNLMSKIAKDRKLYDLILYKQ